MPKEKPDRYFLALVPPQSLNEEVCAQKQNFAKRYSSKAALRSPAHITLHMPFQLTFKRLARLESLLQDTAKGFKPFEVRHEGYGSFPPRVIYIHVAQSESLLQLQKELAKLLRLQFGIMNSTYKGTGYHPHMTIAFRDLKKAKYEEAWPYYQEQEFNKQWTAISFSLLKYNGRVWEANKEFNFKPK